MATPVTCPGCQRPLRLADGVAQTWVTCPHCLARVANPQARGTGDADHLEIEHEVRGDVRKTSSLLIVLAGLGALTLLSAVPAAIEGVHTGDSEVLLGLGLILALLISISTACVLWQRPGKTPLESVGRVAVHTLAIVGSIVAGGIVIGIAVFVFLFAVCLSGGLKF